MALRAPLAMPQRKATPVEPEVPTPTRGRAKARDGKRAAMVWLDPAAVRQLNQIALDEDSTVQALLEEAVSALFVSRGKPRLA